MGSFAKWGWVTVPAILVVVGGSVDCNGGNAKSAVGSGKPVVIFAAEPAGKRGWLEIGWRDPIPLGAC